jgi:pimeloyl-ACP methyl ester carboxylesterase
MSVIASSALSTSPRIRREQLATGLSLSLLEWGHDDPARDHTVVLVHGFLDLAWGWHSTVQAGLGHRYHVVAPDMRGHGDSDRVGAGGYYHFMDYVADLASLVDRVGRSRVSLVGHSMGGAITSYFTGACPKKVHRLALLEGLGPPEDETPAPDRTRLWIQAWKRARAGETKGHESLSAAAERLMANDPKLDRDLALFLAERGTDELPNGRRRFKHDPLHMSRGPYAFRVDVAETFWKSIECPVLLVEGADSPFRLLPDLERRASAFAQARRVVIDDAGHMMQRHQPQRLAGILAEFLG